MKVLVILGFLMLHFVICHAQISIDPSTGCRIGWNRIVNTCYERCHPQYTLMRNGLDCCNANGCYQRASEGYWVRN